MRIRLRSYFFIIVKLKSLNSIAIEIFSFNYNWKISMLDLRIAISRQARDII